MALTLEYLFLWFLLYAFIGWVYESVLVSVSERRWVNRGFLNGPLCPIYGCGAVLAIVLFHHGIGVVLHDLLLIVLHLPACLAFIADKQVLQHFRHVVGLRCAILLHGCGRGTGVHRPCRRTVGDTEHRSEQADDDYHPIVSLIGFPCIGLHAFAIHAGLPSSRQ